MSRFFPVVLSFLTLSAVASPGYIIDVPFGNRDLSGYGGGEKLIAELKRMGTDWAELCCSRYPLDAETRALELATVATNCAILKAAGFCVGARTWSFWCDRKKYTPLTAASSWSAETFACPLDPDFRQMAADYLADFARTGVDYIMMDDDYCYGNRTWKSILCFCDRHRSRLEAALGEKIADPKEFERQVLTGGRNRYRDAWLKTNGEALCEFARAMRRAVDAVNPKVRIALGGQSTLWDNDGVDSATVARLLAGRTKPILRLISGPYWVVEGNFGFGLSDVFEYNRVQRSWCGDDIDVLGEGDVYPRPRTRCPSAYLELFDILLRADGRMGGDVEYVIDYFAPVDYERGYVDRSVRNRPVYDAVGRLFSNKEACGVRVIESMRKLADAVVPDEYAGTTKILRMCEPAAGSFFAENGIPTAYEGEGTYTAAFGENVRALPKETFRRGIVIDAWAARILQSRGVDVGIRSFGEKQPSTWERFLPEDMMEYSQPFDVWRVEVDPKAEVDSEFLWGWGRLKKETSRSPAAYFYENAEGGRFFVLCFDAYFNEGLKPSYARARQLRRGVRRLSGRDLPAFVDGCPYLYLLAKRSSEAMSVGLWNLFADEAYEPTVELDEPYGSVEFINCSGVLEGNKVKLTTVPAYGFAGFEVRKAKER